MHTLRPWSPTLGPPFGDPENRGRDSGSWDQPPAITRCCGDPPPRKRRVAKDRNDGHENPQDDRRPLKDWRETQVGQPGKPDECDQEAEDEDGYRAAIVAQSGTHLEAIAVDS
jgi:hypothetical protein